AALDWKSPSFGSRVAVIIGSIAPGPSGGTACGYAAAIAARNRSPSRATGSYTLADASGIGAMVDRPPTGPGATGRRLRRPVLPAFAPSSTRLFARTPTGFKADPWHPAYPRFLRMMISAAAAATPTTATTHCHHSSPRNPSVTIGTSARERPSLPAP